MRQTRKEKVRSTNWVAAGIVLVFMLFYPALHGPFLLDDFAWFPLLSVTSPSPFTLSFWNYALAGEFTLGRIVPMATFALQSASWPHHPEHFKAVNLALHILNYLLLLCVLRNLLPALGLNDTRRIQLIAIGIATLWAVSPSNVGAVAYAIQRMNLMAAGFSLITLIAYFKARQSLIDTQTARSTAWMALGAVALLAGMFSKENTFAALLVISVIEWRLPAPTGKLLLLLRRFTIAVPWAVLGAYMSSHFSQFLGGYVVRDFSMLDRIALAPESLFRYLKNFFFPTPRDLSLFQDDVTPPDSMFLPLLLLCAWLAIVFLAIRTRGAWRIVSMGLFWFLAAHAIETSIIPLELYFPHRNYFPSMGLSIAAVGLVASGLSTARTRNMKRFAIPLACVVIVGGMMFITAVEALSWADKRVLVEQWYKSHPASDRAAQAYADALINDGDKLAGMQILVARQAKRPNDVLTVLETAALKCNGLPVAESEPDPDWEAMTSDYMIASTSFLINFTEAYANRSDCRPFSSASLRRLAQVLLDRPDSGRVNEGVWLALSKLAVAEEKYEEAAYLMDKIYRDTRRPFRLLDAASMLHAAKGKDAAKSYLRKHIESPPRSLRALLKNAMIREQLDEMDARGEEIKSDEKQ